VSELLRERHQPFVDLLVVLKTASTGGSAYGIQV
jgi:hypothetical protein